MCAYGAGTALEGRIMSNEIVVDVTRFDLVRFNFATLFRIRANWIMLGLIWVFAVLSFLSKNGWTISASSAPLAIGFSVVAAIVGFFFLFSFMMVFTMLSFSKKSGILGKRKFVIEVSGLREVTEATNAVYRWSAILDVLSTKNMLMVRLNQFQFFLIPRDGMDSPLEFDAFCDEVRRKWTTAA